MTEVGSDNVLVWWAGGADRLPWHDRLLGPAERDRVARYRFAADRDRFVLGNALLRLVAAQLTGQDAAQVRIDRNCPDCPVPHGRPRLLEAEVEVSVSHSGPAVLVAAAYQPIGVDVEQLPQGDLDLVLAELLSPQEWPRYRAELAGHDPRRLLLRYWTRKEAALKATGAGLRAPMHTLTLRPTGPDRAVLSLPEGDCHLVDLAPRAEVTAAVAMLGRTAPHLVELDGRPLLHEG